MSDQQKIAEYIDNLSLKKNMFGKVSADDVHEVICELSSMYNEILTEVYHENERLKRLVDDMDETRIIQREEDDLTSENNDSVNDLDQQDKDSDLMHGNVNSRLENEKEQTILEEPSSQNAEEENGLIDKDLRKFKRTELLEILLDQSRENESQKKEIETLKRKIKELQMQLEDRTIRVEKAGTIAEAAFLLNGVYDSTQAAAQQYLDGLVELHERERRNVIEKEEKTEAYVKMRLEETQKACDAKEKHMEDRCAALEHAARERCEFMKEDVRKKCIEREERCRVKCENREKEAEKRCKELDAKAQMDVEKRWDDLSRRLEDFYRSHEGLRELLTKTGEIQR